MSLKIRKIRSSDKKAFFEMSRDFYSSEAVLHNISEEFHENTFFELMKSDVYLDCFIFEYSGDVAGYALINKTFSREAGGSVVWLEELYVKVQYRSKGIGGAFFDFLEKTVPAKRYRLEIEPDNLRAARLYESKGYSSLEYKQMVKDLNNGGNAD